MERHGIVSGLILGRPDSVWLAVLVVLLFCGVLTTATLRSTLPPRWKWSLWSLKILAVLLLAACLLDPRFVRRHARPGENTVVLLADQSASMEIHDSAEARESRFEHAKSLLTAVDSPWLTRLAQDFQIRRYAFGTSLKRLESFEPLQADAPASQLGAALQEVEARFRSSPLAGILLFSDGNSTDDLSLLSAGSVPVFPVVSNHPQTLPDLAISGVSVSQTNFEDVPVTMQVQVEITGPKPKKVRVELREQGATGPPEQSVVLQTGSPAGLLAQFQIKPKRAGVHFYTVNVLPEPESGLLPGTRPAAEATLQNNHRLVAVNRDPHVARILYVAGRPNWEHKYLGRALEEDPQLHLVSLMRIAKKEARFDFRGRAGDSSNSLFRGFKEQADEETEDYSQPVLVRLKTRDAKELSDGFPKTKQDLYQYDAVMIDDLEAAFFQRDQQALIDQFVAERGGALLMLGGRDSYRHGKWEHTPVADTLPVYLNRPRSSPQGELRWSLTREGWLEPWTRRRDTEQAEQAQLQAQPSLAILNSVSEIKPGARVLAEVTDAQGQRSPALVIQNYGHGRAGAVLPGDLWRWSLQEAKPDAHLKDDDAGKFWRQLCRWLTGDVPRRLSATLSSELVQGIPETTLHISVKDREFQPVDGARVTISIRQPDGTELTIPAEPRPDVSGLYTATHVSRIDGGYVARIATSGSADEAPLETQIGWSSNPHEQEFRCAGIQLKALNQLAEQTHGKLVPESELEQFIEELRHRDLPVMETESVQIWHRPWLLCCALGLLCAEWGLRRWKGLA